MDREGRPEGLASSAGIETARKNGIAPSARAAESGDVRKPKVEMCGVVAARAFPRWNAESASQLFQDGQD
jgi:hypothetical protein